MSYYAELRRVCRNYAEAKGLRTSYLSVFAASRYADYADFSNRLTCVAGEVCMSACVCVPSLGRRETSQFLRNLRNTHFVRTLSALIPSAYSLVTILFFSCVTKLKKEKTDSNCSKKEALLLGVCL